MTNSRVRMMFVVMCVGIFLSPQVSAQAFCALRDPLTSIYGFFPEADAHKSIVKVVGNDARVAIRERLPLDLHFNELGKHTIYVAMDGDTPIGVVHARSEGDRWGLTEIVWALSPDLRVIDFSFQRCRNPARQSLEKSDFRAQLEGKSFTELRELLTEDAEEFRTNPSGVPTDAIDLAVTVTHSALKTIVVTDTVWEAELRSLRSKRLLDQHFEQPIQITRVTTPYTPEITSEIARQLSADGTGFDRAALVMSRISNDEDIILGYMIDAPWQSGSTTARLQWLLSNDGKVLKARADALDSEKALQESLDRLIGFEASDVAHCANALELSAFELNLLARKHSDH